jgi:hypothetical protein
LPFVTEICSEFEIRWPIATRTLDWSTQTRRTALDRGNLYKAHTSSQAPGIDDKIAPIGSAQNGQQMSFLPARPKYIFATLLWREEFDADSEPWDWLRRNAALLSCFFGRHACDWPDFRRCA